MGLIVSQYLQESSYEFPDSWQKVPARWGHSFHTLCPRTGSFPPRLAHYFIAKYSGPGERVLDLYSGKGTAPLEACLLGRIGIGNDAAPDAYTLTYAKTHAPPKAKVLNYIEKLRSRLRHSVSIDDVEEKVRIYYSPSTLKQILALRNILDDDERKFKNEDQTAYGMVIFVKALILGILHGRQSYSLSLPCPHSFAMSPTYVKKRVEEDPVAFKCPDRDVIKCLKSKLNLVCHDDLFPSYRYGEAYYGDATQLDLSESVDLILTSPPYYNRHTYAWDNWLRLWFLGYDYKVVRRSLLETDSEIKYTKHMKESLNRMYKLLKDGSACFIVTGDVRGRKPITMIITDIIEKCEDLGFTVHKLITDHMRRERRYPYGNNNHTGILSGTIVELHKGDINELGNKASYSYNII